jgi:type IV pilus assembly protein PilV
MTILKTASGFTLLEGMIATAILSVGVLAIGSMQGIALKRNVDSTELTQAVNLATDMMERIQYNRRNVVAYAGLDTLNACGQDPVAQPMALGDCTQWQALLNGIASTGISQGSGLRGVTGTGVVRGRVQVAPLIKIPTLNQNQVTVIVTWSGLSMGNTAAITRSVSISSIVAAE